MRVERLSNTAAWMSAYEPYDPKRTLMPVVGIRQGPAALISYVSKSNRRGDRRNPHRKE